MSTKDDFEVKREVIEAIADDQTKIPNSIPVDVYVQEAENLFKWCQKDKDALTAVGMPWELVEDLPVRSGALREAESRWNLVRFSGEEAERMWAEKSPQAYEYRDWLLSDFRFAYREHGDLLRKLTAIADGESHADMIQDLNDLSVLGKEHPEPLTAVKFDMTRLDNAAELSDDMASLLADATTDRDEYKEAKKIRDKAFTHLKEAVDEIYEYGQYVFRRNEARRKGYRSKYLRRKRNRQTLNANGSTEEAAA
jgi:hypothetical protein